MKKIIGQRPARTVTRLPLRGMHPPVSPGS